MGGRLGQTFSERVVSGQTLLSNRLLRNVMDMAMQRIVNSNNDFSNAVITRAHIRVVGKCIKEANI